MGGYTPPCGTTAAEGGLPPSTMICLAAAAEGGVPPSGIIHTAAARGGIPPPRDLKKIGKTFLLNPVGPSYGAFFCNLFLNIHLYDLLDVLDLVDELHLCHPLVVLEPAD